MPSTVTRPSDSGVVIGEMCWMPMRWLAVSMKPPVPGVEASRKVSGDTQRALPAVSITCRSETFLALSRFGSTCTCSCLARSPQIDTFATPGTPSRRGTMVQRASTDIWIGDSDFESTPTISTRFVDDRGWRICGGLETFGRACACVKRSATTWRALKRSVPGSKTRRIRETRHRLRADVPEARDAVEQVLLDRHRDQLLDLLGGQTERLGLHLDGDGGAYSGSTSTGASRSCMTPTATTAAAIATTRIRNRRLVPMIDRMAAS